MARLRQAHYSGSTLDKCDVTLLNKHAALVDATWSRRDEVNESIVPFSVTYLIAFTVDGWRITTAVETAG